MTVRDFLRAPRPPRKLLLVAIFAMWMLVACLGDKVAGGSSTTDTGNEISLTGRVIDKDNAPVTGVVVALGKSGLADTTNALGVYHVQGELQREGEFADTLRFTRLGQEIATLPVVRRVDSLPDVKIVQRDISGGLLPSPVGVARIEGVLSGDGIPAESPLAAEFFYNRPANHYSGFVYFPAAAQLQQYNVYVNVYDSAGRFTGRSRNIGFSSLAGNLVIPAFDPGNAVPAAFAGRDTVMGIGEALALKGTAVDSFGGVIVTWEWSIGGGPFIRTSSGDTIITMPAAPVDSFPCVLRVTDDHGNVATDTLRVEVVLDPPSAVIMGQATVKVGVPATFTAHVTQRFGSVVMYTWDDGKSAGWDDSGATLTQKSFTYSTQGVYPVRLRVRDDKGNTDTVTFVQTIWNDNPAVAGLRDTIVEVGDTLTFTLAAVDPEGLRPHYVWEFNGVKDSTTAATRSFVMPSTQQSVIVSVTVRDNYDGVTRLVANVFVSANLPWTQRSGAPAVELRGVIWAPVPDSAHGLFVAMGESVLGGGTSIVTSPDGVNWTRRASTATTGMYSIAWNGTRFIAVGGVVLTSLDGMNWTEVPTVFGAIYSVAWNGSIFVVAGAGSQIFTSSDGLTWIQQPSGQVTGVHFTSVSWGAGLFVIAGQGGIVLTSTDGTNWTQRRANGDSQAIRAVTWSGNQFVAVGDGVVLTSPNGILWTVQDTAPSTVMNAVTWDGERFVAVGFTGQIWTSPGGVSWTEEASGTSRVLNGVTSGNGRFVVVGDAGVILTSP